jgi:hypothetical protein
MDEFRKIVKNEYSSEIEIDYSKHIQNIINRLNFKFENLVSLIDHGWFFAWSMHNANYYFNSCEVMVKAGHRHFKYIKCNMIEIDEPLFLFFATCDENIVYNKLVRLENLKAFL